MKKRMLILMVVLSLLLSALAACSGNKTTETENETKTANKVEEKTDDKTAEQTEKQAAEQTEKPGDKNGDGKIIVGYISKNIVDPFHAPINSYAEETLNKMVKDGIIDEWTGVLDGETDANKQIDRADECLSKNCDYVIILPAEAAASDAAVTKLADAGVAVLVVNSKTDSTDDVALAYVGPDDVAAGKMLADWVVDQVPAGGKYAHCQGVIGNSAQIQRGEGIKEVMDANDKFESVGDFPCDWQADKAANVASDMISQHGKDLVAIICDNDDMSSAAQRACNEAGRSDIVCVGVDGNPNPLQMVKDGEMGATVLQDGPAQVAGAIDLIQKDIQGEKVEKEVAIPFVLVTKENVDEYLK